MAGDVLQGVNSKRVEDLIAVLRQMREMETSGTSTSQARAEIVRIVNQIRATIVTSVPKRRQFERVGPSEDPTDTEPELLLQSGAAADIQAMSAVADVSSSFSPRLSPRPEYPPFARVAGRWAWVNVRDMLFGVAFCFALHPAYARMSEFFGAREYYAMTVCAAHTLTYVLFNGLLYVLEQLRFEPLLRCAIGRKASERPSWPLVKQLLSEAAINHLVTSPITSLLVFSLADALGMPAANAPLPSPLHMAGLFAAAHTFNDFTFYWTHRLLHSKLLYARFHKQHHAFRGSVGAAAEFAGPTEVVLSNQLPTVGLLLAVGAHPLVQAAWLVLRLTQTYEVHSGYEFSDTLIGRLGLTANETSHHDHHHSVNLGNFGAEHTDWLFGTMDHFLAGGERQGYVQKRAEYTAAQEKEAAEAKAK